MTVIGVLEHFQSCASLNNSLTQSEANESSGDAVTNANPPVLHAIIAKHGHDYEHDSPGTLTVQI